MSMLSAQCDELRSMAVSVGLDMPQAATLMMGAADAIEGLESENDKLREQGARLFDKTLELGTENAKLRELCADLYAEMITYSNAPNYNVSVWAPKLRELGVEVTA